MSISKLTPQFAWAIHFSCLPQLVSYSTTVYLVPRPLTSRKHVGSCILELFHHMSVTCTLRHIPRILAMARLTHLPHSMLVTSPLPFFRSHQTHFSLPNSTGALPLSRGTTAVYASDTKHHGGTLRHRHNHLPLLMASTNTYIYNSNFFGLCTPSLGPYRTLPISNTLPSFSYTSIFFPICFDTFAYFLHQGGTKGLNYRVQRSMRDIPLGILLRQHLKFHTLQ
jgi:hypothetical protein